MRLLVLGLNHRTAPVELRERVAFLGDEARDVLTTLRAHEAFQETALLSTCNRTELYVATPSPDDVVARWRELVRARRQVDLHDDVLYRHESRECVQHLMRVASGIDSMVLGETGILGQVRDAHTLATQEDTLGPLLGRLLPTALHAGKRARTETTIGEGAVSLAKAGVTLARKVFGDLSKRRVLVVGSGETGAQTAAHLAEEGGARITFANRTLERAEKLAKLHGGTAIGLDGVLGLLGEVDLVVTAVGAPDPILTVAQTTAALERRKKGRSLLIVDLGVPRNVEPAVGEHEAVFLYSVDDLDQLVTLNLEKRKREVPKVERIVNEETSRYEEWLTSLGATPVLVAVRERVESLRQESLEKFARSLPDEERDRLEKFSRALTNKLLHGPTTSLRGCDPSTREGLARLEWTRRMFGLDGREGDAE